jgi:hypothetical protein
MEINKIKRGTKKVCVACGKRATKDINDQPYCAHCGDVVLLKTIKMCIVHIEKATIKLGVMPKGVTRARKESSKS